MCGGMNSGRSEGAVKLVRDEGLECFPDLISDQRRHWNAGTTGGLLKGASNEVATPRGLLLKALLHFVVFDDAFVFCKSR